MIAAVSLNTLRSLAIVAGLIVAVIWIAIPVDAGPTDDSDGDGIQNQFEDANLDLDGDETTNPGPDTDGDTTPDYLDGDDDGDGVPTLLENADPNADGNPRDALDRDRDGQPDYLDVEAGPSNGQIEDEQKISDLVGGLVAPLDDYDYFGYSLTAIGDVDGDGIADLAVGANLDDDGGADRGAVYILFLNSNGTVRAEQKISSTQGGFAGPLADGDQWGYELAGIGDLDGDSIPDLVVGAFRDGDGGGDTGAAYVLFLNSNGTVRAEQKISALSGGLTGPLTVGDQFGYAIGALGDLDGDGVVDVMVGGRNGPTYILFLNPDGTVNAEQTMGRGHSSAGIGDLDGDGVTDVVVGVPWISDAGGWSGGVEIRFMNSDGTVKSTQLISAASGGLVGPLESADYFGIAVAGVGDIDGDGLPDVIAGAYWDDEGGPRRGTVYVLFLNADGTVKDEQRITSIEGGLTGPIDDFDGMGTGLASLGDLDGDGKPNIAIGVGYDDDGGTENGAVYVADLSLSPTVVVNSTGDGADATPGDGRCETGGTNSEGVRECTLRAAIEEATASALIDTIEFAIPNTDPNHLYHRDDAVADSLSAPVSTALADAAITDFDPDYPVSQFSWWTIDLGSSLPDIPDGTTIDGTTQPGWRPNTNSGGGPTNAVLPIVLTTNAGYIMNMEGDGSTVRGLNFSSAGAAGTMLYVDWDSNTVDGSWFMVDPVGTSNGSGDDGIWVITLSTNVTIGGPDPEDHVLIGNGLSNSGLTVISDGATVQNVWIGVGADGQLLPGYNDIPLVVSGNDNVIGTPGAGVVVGSSLNEVLILEGDRNVVQDGLFGFLPDGTPTIAAASTIDGSDNLIGGIAPGEANSFHGGEFGYVASIEGGSGNSLLGNTYIGSTGLNIDILPLGPNPNDPGDADAGDNDLLNHPVITGAVTTAGVTTVDFDLDVPAGTYRVEFYGDLAGQPNPTGYGAGEVLAAGTTISHTGGGAESFQTTIPDLGAYHLSAAATADLGAGDFGSTSEFSALVVVAGLDHVVVNSTGDAGDVNPGDGLCATGEISADGRAECTLRAALEEANASAMIDTVEFDIPLADSGHNAGIWTITVPAGLPNIVAPITIDGSTQPGYVPNTNPAPLPMNALPLIELDGGGLDNGDGLHLAAGAAGSTIHALAIGGFNGSSNYGIEVNADDVAITASVVGLRADGTTDNASAYGVVVNANRTQIGGLNAADRNLIAGTQPAQVLIESGADLQILGNILGADLTTTTVPGLWGTGVAAWNGTNVTIGSVAAPNVIAGGPFEWGIEGGANNLVIDGNLIGTNATYTADLGDWRAIFASDNTTITNNVIGNFDEGLDLDGANIIVTGNFIGTDPSGTLDLGNTDYGVRLRAGGNAMIGGTTAGEENVIAFNGGDGLRVDNLATSTVIGNRIFGNGSLGIDYNDDDLTLNDSPDTDGVPNHPIIVDIREDAGELLVDLDLEAPTGTYRIELFSNPAGGDASGNGEGQYLIGTASMVHGGSGLETVTVRVPAGSNLAATATRDLGGTFGGTSEFSTTASTPSETLTVNSTGDSGDANPGDGVCFTSSTNAEGVPECTLRAAIEEANASTPIETIQFAIPASDAGHVAGIWTIAPAVAPLPPLTAPAGIDATTQSGAACDAAQGLHSITVVLDGASLNSSSDGLVLAGGGASVEGLSIDGFGDNGIEILSDANAVRCNFIGVGPDGVTSQQRLSTAVSVDGDNNLIGGIGSVERNVLSTGTGTGVEVLAGSTETTIQSNHIGTDVTGTVAVPNWSSGILLDGDIDTAIRNNVISGNWDGVFLSGSTGAIIDHNRIGTTAGGDTALANQGVGMWVGDASTGVLVRDNVISGNTSHAMYITSSATGTVIVGNHIGVDEAGSDPVPNGSGIYSFGPIVVGGATAPDQNLISQNAGSGISFFGSAVSESVVQGNVISANTGDGISAAGTGRDTTILNNSIALNGGLGVDHGIDGVTANSPSDGVLNHPAIALAESDGGTVFVEFDLDVPAGTYRIEAFTNPSGGDPSGYGEGEQFVGAIVVTKQGSGVERFQLAYNGAVGDLVALTATIDRGDNVFGATSEFSRIATVVEREVAPPTTTTTTIVPATTTAPVAPTTAAPTTLAPTTVPSTTITPTPTTAATPSTTAAPSTTNAVRPPIEAPPASLPMADPVFGETPAEDALLTLSASTALAFEDDDRTLGLASFLAPILAVQHLHLPLGQLLPILLIGAIAILLALWALRDRRLVQVAAVGRYRHAVGEADDHSAMPIHLAADARLLWARRRMPWSRPDRVDVQTPVGRAKVSADEISTM